MSDVVWSINIMLALLLVGVGVSIYWIFKYDDWNPNPIITSDTITSVAPSNRDSSESTHGSFISDGGVDRKDKKS